MTLITISLYHGNKESADISDTECEPLSDYQMDYKDIAYCIITDSIGDRYHNSER